MAIAIALVVLVLATVLFHFLSPWQLTPLASNWASMDATIDITLWVTGAVFVAINLFMAYSIWRYRHRADRRSHYQPENSRLEGWLTVLTALGIGALLAPGLTVWAAFVDVPEAARDIEIVGQQWHWSFRFPGEDGQFGAVRPRMISEANPYGLDPGDTHARDDVLVRSPHVLLPVGEPFRAVLRSKDVLHNFQVAQFRVKMDLVPGQVSYLWLTPTRTGEFDILCAELCGIAHFAMRGRVRVVERDEFDDWLAAQPTFGELQALPAADPAAGAGLYAICIACHGARGEGNRDLNAPRLAGLPPWYVQRQLDYFRSGVRGAHPEDTYGAQMRAFAATLADDQAVADVAAYIHSLDGAVPEPTVGGDSARGARAWRTCGACHGARAEGIAAVNAPRLTGLPDWYLIRQLEHFQRGVRGRHAGDHYGWQMAEMSKTLVDAQAIRDVVAYLNTLPVEMGAPAAGGP